MAESGNNALFFAVDRKKIEMTKFLLSKGLQVDLPGNHGDTPLYRAVFHQNPKLIKMLIDQKADPNLANKKGLTPLHVAALRNSVPIMKQLLTSKKLQLNPQDIDGDSPLHLTAALGKLAAIEFLLKQGADPLLKNKKGKTMLDVAKEKKQLGVILLYQKMKTGSKKVRLKKPR